MSRGTDDSFFFHFLAGSLIVVFLLVTPMVFLLLAAIWQQGLVFTTVLGLGLAAFGWVTHKLAAIIQTKENWF